MGEVTLQIGAPPIEIAEGLVVRPGDTLVVRVRRPISMADAARLKGMLAERLPGVEFAIVAAEQIAVYRPEVADE